MRSQGTRIAAFAAGGVLLVGFGAAGMRAWDVHQATADWALWPQAVPSRVDYSGRSFNCGPESRKSVTLDGLSLRGRTSGGGEIYAGTPREGSSTVTSIVVKDAAGSFACNLMGGP